MRRLWRLAAVNAVVLFAWVGPAAAQTAIDLRSGACKPSITSSRPAVGGTSAAMVIDRNPATGLRTNFENWQYVQINFDCEVEVLALRRRMTRVDGTTSGLRRSQGESVSYSADGAVFTDLPAAGATGWEAYVAYSPRAWHSVGYGTSAWLRPRQPLRARALRFHWDGNRDLLSELELDYRSRLRFWSPGTLPYTFAWPLARAGGPIVIGERDCLVNIFSCRRPGNTPESLFPERVRAAWLFPAVPAARPRQCRDDAACDAGAHCYQGSCVPDSAWYSFETCEIADVPGTAEKVRVAFDELDGFAGRFQSNVLGWPSCAGGGCFLRVNTAHLGRRVTLLPAGVSCDDPASVALGSCGVGMDSATDSGANDQAGYRGNVIIADRIEVFGDIDLGSLSLVLIAQQSIEFLPGTRIRGSPTLPVPPAPAAAPVPTYRTTVGNLTGQAALDWAIPATLPSGGPGAPGGASGTLVLIAPRVIGETDIDLHGQPGGAAQDGSAVDCAWPPGPHLVNALTAGLRNAFCRNATNALLAQSPPAGGRGGAGGAAGRVIIRSGQAVPATIRSQLSGGAGGAGGRAGTYRFYENQTQNGTTISLLRTRALGSNGADGTRGADGSVDSGSLGDDYLDFAYLFARRGAERHLVNGRHFARFPATDAGRGNATAAARHLVTLLEEYCGFGLLLVRPPVLIGGSPPAVPTPLVTGATREARRQACEEARLRLDRLSEGLNYFGFPPDFFMYVPPDEVAETRQGLLDAFTVPGGPRETFWDIALEDRTRQITQGLLDDRAALERRIVEAEMKSAEIALARQEHLAKKAFTAMTRVERNQEQMRDLQQRMGTLSEEAQNLLQPEECDFFCVLEQIISFAGDILSLIAGSIDTIANLVDFVDGFGELWDAFDRIHDQTFGDELDSFLLGDASLDLIFQQAMGRYAKQFWEGIEAQDVTGAKDVREAAAEIPDNWRKVKDNAEALSTLLSGEPSGVVDAIMRLGAQNAATADKLLDMQVYLRETLERARTGSGFVDQAGGVARLEQMVAVADRQIDLARESDALLEEHALAMVEQRLAEMEAQLAELRAAQAEAAFSRTECRLGRLAGEVCQGVTPLDENRALRTVARDATCRTASRMNDQILLFDFLYQRARDFVLLEWESSPASARSHDFQRNLLIPADDADFARVQIEDVVQEFVDRLDPRQAGLETRTYCQHDPTQCEPDSAAVLTQLLMSGVAQFDLGLAASSDRQRMRVANADVDLLLAGGYRLGCDSPANCPPHQIPNLPPDRPLQQQVFQMHLSHGDAATFRMTPSAWDSFLFSSSFPEVTCDVVSNFLGVRRDCRGLATFTDTIAYPVPSEHAQHRAARQVYDPVNFQVNPMFGTSVAGRWELDIRPILRNLNGGLEPNDGCYDFAEDAAATLPDACFPADLAGRSGPDLPEVWQRDAAGRTGVEKLCGGFVLHQALETYGVRGYDEDGRCCTAAGTLAPGRNVNACNALGFVNAASCVTGTPADCCTQDGFLDQDRDAPACDALGFISDASCRTPDLCWEICGPRCQAFKRSLLGFDFRVHWREGIQR